MARLVNQRRLYKGSSDWAKIRVNGQSYWEEWENVPGREYRMCKVPVVKSEEFFKKKKASVAVHKSEG